MDRVRLESEKPGLLLNAKKTKVMKLEDRLLKKMMEFVRRKKFPKMELIKINDKSIENAKQFTYSGVVFTDSYDDCVEIKKRLAIVRNPTLVLKTIWKDKTYKTGRDKTII